MSLRFEDFAIFRHYGWQFWPPLPDAIACLYLDGTTIAKSEITYTCLCLGICMQYIRLDWLYLDVIILEYICYTQQRAIRIDTYDGISTQACLTMWARLSISLPVPGWLVSGHSGNGLGQGRAVKTNILHYWHSHLRLGPKKFYKVPQKVSRIFNVWPLPNRHPLDT